MSVITIDWRHYVMPHFDGTATARVYPTKGIGKPISGPALIFVRGESEPQVYRAITGHLLKADNVADFLQRLQADESLITGTSDFMHKPKVRALDRFSVRPGTIEWALMWAAANAAGLKDDGYIGHDGKYWYFQRWGVTTGFARLPRSEEQS